MGIPYPNIWEERIHNYLIGARELSLLIVPMCDHFGVVVGMSVTFIHNGAMSSRSR